MYLMVVERHISMQYQRNPNKTIVGFCEDLWANGSPTLPNPRTLRALPILRLLRVIYLWCVLGRWERGVAAFYGLILVCLTAFPS